jgi:hypothetical protein
MDSHLRDFAGNIFVVLTVLIIGSTAVSVIFGPNPFLVYSDLLTEEGFGLNETRDNIALLFWWVSIGSVSLLTWRVFNNQTQHQNILRLSSKGEKIRTVVGTVAVLGIYANLFLDLDRRYTDNVRRFTPIEIVVGLLVSALLFQLISGSLRNKTWLFLVLSFFAPLLALTSLVQSPGTIRDYYHSSFSLNELAAPLAGMTPHSDFFPQYTSLLGIPVAALGSLFADKTFLLVLLWTISLQLFSLLVPVFVTHQIATWKVSAIAALLMTSALLSGPSHQTIGSVAGYFASFPIRTVFPSLLLLYLVFCIKSPTEAPCRPVSISIIGFLGGLSMLNNPDFGGSAFAAGLIVVLFFLTDRRNRVLLAANYVSSGIAAFVLYDLIGRVSGNAVKWNHFFLFQRIFGSVGAGKETMAVGGLHVVYVVTFGIGLVVATLAWSRAKKLRSIGLTKTAVFLSFSSLWALGTLPYFVGRSYTSTIFGHNYQLGLVVVGLLLYWSLDRDFLQDAAKEPFLRTVALVLFIPFLYLSLLVTRLPNPSVSFANLRASSVENSELLSLEADVAELLTYVNRDTSQPDIQQLLILSNFIEQTTGVEAGLVVSHPGYLYTSPVLMELQCQSLVANDPQYVIEMNWVETIDRESGCNKWLNFLVIATTPGDYGLRLLETTKKSN